MSTWLERTTEWFHSAAASRRVQLAGTAVVSGAAVATVILGYQNIRQQQRAESLKDSIPPLDYSRLQDKALTFAKAGSGSSEPQSGNDRIVEDEESKRNEKLARRAREGDYDNDLILEQLARNRVFLSDDGLEKVRSAFVIVVGLGGVGSHAAAALARSGVSQIRLIDFDQVTLSSLNRHAVANLADVGTPKVHCMRKRLEQVTPWVQFDCRNELFSADAAASQLSPLQHTGQSPDFVIDAIDNIDSKVELLRSCHARGLPVISSMGAGCKSDPTRVFIGDISASAEDPLSRATRRRLRAAGVANGIPVVFSTEKAAPDKAHLLPLPEEEFAKGAVGDLSVLPSFRARILPVLGTMPAVFGLAAANHVLLTLAGYPAGEYLAAKARDKLYDGMLASLQGSEERLARHEGRDGRGLRLPISQDDVGFLVDEVFRGRSVVSGLPTRLALVRWERGDGELVDEGVEGQKVARLQMTDVVCMTKDEAARHEKEVLKGGKRVEEVYESEVLETVRARREEVKVCEQYR